MRKLPKTRTIGVYITTMFIPGSYQIRLRSLVAISPRAQIFKHKTTHFYLLHAKETHYSISILININSKFTRINEFLIIDIFIFNVSLSKIALGELITEYLFFNNFSLYFTDCNIYLIII